MPSTESVNNFISEVLTWIDSHDYIEDGDNTYTSGSGDLSVTIHSKGVSSQTVLPVFSDTGRWQMVFTAERDVMSWLVRSLRSHGWHVSGTDANGGYLTAERDNGRLHIRVHGGIIDRSVRIEGNGQSLASMHLNNAGFLKTSDNVPGDSDRYQVADWLLNQYKS